MGLPSSFFFSLTFVSLVFMLFCYSFDFLVKVYPSTAEPAHAKNTLVNGAENRGNIPVDISLRDMVKNRL